MEDITFNTWLSDIKIKANSKIKYIEYCDNLIYVLIKNTLYTIDVNKKCKELYTYDETFYEFVCIKIETNIYFIFTTCITIISKNGTLIKKINIQSSNNKSFKRRISEIDEFRFITYDYFEYSITIINYEHNIIQEKINIGYGIYDIYYYNNKFYVYTYVDNEFDIVNNLMIYDKDFKLCETTHDIYNILLIWNIHKLLYDNYIIIEDAMCDIFLCDATNNTIIYQYEFYTDKYISKFVYNDSIYIIKRDINYSKKNNNYVYHISLI